MKEETFPAYWPEQVQYSSEDINVVPPWKLVEAQAIAARQMLVQSRNEGEAVPEIGPLLSNRKYFGTVRFPIPYEDFDPKNIHCFQFVPVVHQTREALGKTLERTLRNQFPPAKVSALADQFRMELAHTTFHHVMWRNSGRRIYVLDQTTFTLLAHTELPPLPASILCMPEHSFYLKLPRQSFEFGVWNSYQETQDTQQIEGVLVSVDNIDPDSPKQRELSLLIVGTGDSTSDRNIAYISLTLGPDAKLDSIQIGNGLVKPAQEYGSGLLVSSPEKENDRYANPIFPGSYELGVIVPRVILGFLLYLQSEHPDVEPVPPAPRRTFKQVFNMTRSQKQAENAMANQELRLRGKTRLPILYVGRHLAQEVADQIAEQTVGHKDFNHEGVEQVKIWSLQHQVWVRGHWKKQRYGTGRTEVKIIWIRPYVKGPDVAASLKARALKIQRAQPASSTEQVEVSADAPRIQHRMKSTGTGT